MTDYNREDVKVGSIVQLHPYELGNPMFGACFMVVTELKSWGVQGFVQALGSNGEPGGQAYYRAKWEEFEPTGGTVVWAPQDLEITGED